MHKKIITPIIISVLVAGGLGFFAGSQYAKRSVSTQAAQFRGQFGSQNGGFGGQGSQGGIRMRGAGGGVVMGDILSKDATSITVSMQSGGSKIVFLSNGTAIAKSVSGSASDLVIGEHVLINGTANSDGSLTAQMIQLRPSVASSTLR